VSDPIRRVTTLQSPVFLVNSRYPLFCVTFFFLKKALLIPKLRRQFAEFLQHDSLYAFVLLHKSTCVGLSTVFYLGKT